MDRTPVDSSVIAALRFDHSTNTLEVEFRTGRVYRYFLVPARVYESLMKAESIGGYFNHEIRDRYSSREIT